MKTWFLCTVRYQKQDEQGAVQKVSEAYLVDAVSFSEAEERIYEEVGNFVKGDFIVSNISKSNFTEIFFYEDAETWYKSKMTYMMEEEGKKPKKISNYILVTAHDIKEAFERIEEQLKTFLVPYSLVSIVESSLLEVFPYVPKDEKIPKNLIPLGEKEEK